MSLESLAIQAEAWAQEEIAAQRELLGILGAAERSARSGAPLAQDGTELEAALARAPARDARRRALFGKLGAALGITPAALTLRALLGRLEQEGLETRRLAALRAELRELAAKLVRAGRRLDALARYHRGLLEELCALLVAREGASAGGSLVDAEA